MRDYKDPIRDIRDRIGSHSSFDDPRWWVFERNSRLPWGYFHRWDDLGHWLIGALAYIGCLVFVVMAALRVFE